jgi:hypothetical protein
MSAKPANQRSKSDLVLEARREGCAGCLYFSIADPSDSHGECRRSAPSRDARITVAKGYWCGEFLPL